MKILHLFYDLMNLYGEYANTLALQRALSEKGRAADIERLSVGDTLDFSSVDFIYIGSGTEKNQKVALEYLKPYADQLKSVLADGKILLATGNSFEMFGKTITDRNGVQCDGLNFFDFTVNGNGKDTCDDTAIDNKTIRKIAPEQRRIRENLVKNGDIVKQFCTKKTKQNTAY